MKRSKKNWWEINTPAEMELKNPEQYDPKDFRKFSANQRRKKISKISKSASPSIEIKNNWQRFLRWLRSYF